MRTLPTTLLQIFCKIIPISKVIIKSIIDADDKLVSINGLTHSCSELIPSNAKATFVQSTGMQSFVKIL